MDWIVGVLTALATVSAAMLAFYKFARSHKTDHQKKRFELIEHLEKIDLHSTDPKTILINIERFKNYFEITADVSMKEINSLLSSSSPGVMISLFKKNSKRMTLDGKSIKRSYDFEIRTRKILRFEAIFAFFAFLLISFGWFLILQYPGKSEAVIGGVLSTGLLWPLYRSLVDLYDEVYDTNRMRKLITESDTSPETVASTSRFVNPLINSSGGTP
jgi:hypothetical protein